MFTKLRFAYDIDGRKREEPLFLTARDTRSKHYYLESSSYRTAEFYDLPAIHICRESKELRTDPYNEDGRPPSLMTIIVHPRVTFLGGVIEIFGFERPNMCWAGHPRPAYEWQPALKVPKARLWPLAGGFTKHGGRSSLREAAFGGMEGLQKQCVVLS